MTNSYPQRLTLPQLNELAAKRRIVLLREDGSIERVLSEPGAIGAHLVHDEIYCLSVLHPGRIVAAEWWDDKTQKWTSWLLRRG